MYIFLAFLIGNSVRQLAMPPSIILRHYVTHTYHVPCTDRPTRANYIVRGRFDGTGLMPASLIGNIIKPCTSTAASRARDDSRIFNA